MGWGEGGRGGGGGSNLPTGFKKIFLKRKLTILSPKFELFKFKNVEICCSYYVWNLWLTFGMLKVFLQKLQKKKSSFDQSQSKI